MIAAAALVATLLDAGTLTLGLGSSTFAEGNPAARLVLAAGGIPLAAAARLALLALAFALAAIVARPGRWGAARPRVATGILAIAAIAGAVGTASNVLALA